MKKVIMLALCAVAAAASYAKPYQIFNDDQAAFLKNQVIVTDKDVDSIPGYNITTYRKNGKIWKVVTNAVFQVTGKQNNNPLLGKLQLSEEQRVAISNRLVQAQANLAAINAQLAEKIAENEQLQTLATNLQAKVTKATEDLQAAKGKLQETKEKLTEAAANNKLLAPIINAIKKAIFGDDDDDGS